MMLDSVLAEALARGSQVVTGNQRAARTLRRGFDAAMREAGQSHWEPAAISTLDQWLAGLWHRRLLEGEDDRILLNRSQEQALWTSVIRADEPSLPAASLAALAAEAWSRLLLHNGRTGLREAGISADTRAFQRWVQGFERRLGRERWLTVAQLPSELQAAVEEGSLAVPDAGLMVVGFDVITPAVEGLFESLRLAGFAVVSHQAVSPNVHRYLAAYEDETAEIRAAARFARECLRGPGLKPDASGGSMSGLKPGPTPSAGTGAPKAGTGAEDRLRQEPGARIAIVVPNLAERKLAIGRGFREVFSPAGEDAPFEFSLGQAMADTALAATALDLLRWTQHSLPIETIGALLQSPWFGASLGDTTVLAEFDAFELRRLPLLRPELTLVQMIAVLERSKWRSRLGDVLARLRAMQEIAAGRAQTSHEGWAEAFRDVLEAARLERRANSDSIGFQTLRSWDSALDELATLDFDGVAVSAGSALESLERIAAETIFAPESQDAPIQIMGPLEAAGSTFDVLWVMGAGEVTWPPQAVTTPLLPWRLQQQLAMPGADAARERELAERLTDRLAGSAGTVVFSHAATLADGAQQASPLLAALGLTDGPINERNTGILHYVQDDGSLRGDGHSVRDDKRLRRGEALAYELVPDVTTLPSLPARAVRGGASVLAAQAACPFQAFATYRLGATELEARETGQDARERGSDVHEVMQKFWAGVKDQETLRGLTLEERHAELDRAIEEVVGETQGHSAWDAAYLAVQRRRLRQLLRPWLEIEVGRPAFAVRQQEGEQEAALGPLRLRLRYDRVDQTAGGDLILDYKTGAASSKDWLSERPDAPQLPIYAVLSGAEELGGVAFALLRPGKGLDLEGFAGDDTVLAKPKNDLPFALQVEEWRRVLTNLAEDFAGGVATVDPKEYPKTCRRCSQRVLCRLDLTTLEEADEDEDESEDVEDEAAVG